MTEEDVELENRRAHIRFLQRENLRMYMFEKDSEKFVGTTGFHNINWNVASFEIGYWLDSRYTGKGYMTEAVQALTTYAFNELLANRVVIKCDPSNLRSKAVAERATYILEGIHKSDSKATDGITLRDTMVFAKTKE